LAASFLRLFQGLDTGLKLQLFARLEFDGDGTQVDVQDLAGDGCHALILAAF
jgi:hypothetical protein